MKWRYKRMCAGLSLIIVLAICVGILIRKETANHPSKYLSNEQYAEQLDVIGIPCTYADFIAQKEKSVQYNNRFLQTEFLLSLLTTTVLVTTFIPIFGVMTFLIRN